MLRPAIMCEPVSAALGDSELRMLQSNLTASDLAVARTRKETIVPTPPRKIKGFLLPQGPLHFSLIAATIGGPMRPANGPDNTKMGIWVLGTPSEDR